MCYQSCPHWLFDVDGTLYSAQTGLLDEIIRRIFDYTSLCTGLGQQAAIDLAYQYFYEYGNTLVGLVKHHGVDAREYLEYIHDIPIQQYIPAPDPMLRLILEQLPGRRVLFTNSIRNHAQRITDALGISDLFTLTIDAIDMLPHSKPDHEAFHMLLDRTGASPDRCILIEDTASAIQAGRQLGIRGVLIGKTGPVDGVDLVIPSVHDLAGIWQKLVA